VFDIFTDSIKWWESSSLFSFLSTSYVGNASLYLTVFLHYGKYKDQLKL